MEAKFLSSRFTRRSFLSGLGATAALPILAACQPQVVEKTVEVPVVVKETVVVEKVVVKEVVVEKPVEVVKQEIVEREKVVEIEKVVTAAPAMREPVTLRFTHWHGGFWDNMIPIIEEKYPHLTLISESTPYSQYPTKVMTQAAGGVAGDVIMVDTSWAVNPITKGVLAPFDDHLKAARIDNYLWDVDPWKWAGYKGKLYALTIVYQPNHQMVINRNLLEKDGIKMPPIWTLDGPTEGYDTWHWDDLVEFLKSLTKVTSAGKVEQYGLDMPFANSLYYNSLYMIYSNGGHLFDQDWEYAETETRVNTPEVIEALQNAVDLSEKHKVVPSVEEARAVKGGLFLAQKAAVQITHPGPASYREHIKSMELEFAPVPWYKHRIQFVGSNSYGINSAGPHQDDAALFAIAATTNEDVGWWFTSTINLIGYDMRAQMAKLPRDAYFLKIYENFLARDDKFSAYRPATENTKWMPRWAGRKPSLMRNTMNAEVEKVLLGEQTMKQAMANVQKKVDPELKKD